LGLGIEGGEIMRRLSSWGGAVVAGGTLFLAGMVFAAFTAIPTLILIGDRFRCAFETCFDPVSVNQSAASASWVTAIVTALAATTGVVNLYLVGLTFRDQRKTRIAELRSYLTISAILATHNSYFFLIELAVRNTGATPAMVKAIYARCRVIASPNNFYELDGYSPDTFDLAASSELTAHVGFMFNAELIELANNDSGRTYQILVVGTVIYDDIFGREREYDFSFEGRVGGDGPVALTRTSAPVHVTGHSRPHRAQ
jgi:uncharacterized membrane protein